jgi:hypothetical protein
LRIKTIKNFHVTPFLIYEFAAHSVTIAKRKRGLKFTIHKLQSLVKAAEELIPISSTEWERVWDMHMACYPKQNQTIESLKSKFQEMAKLQGVCDKVLAGNFVDDTCTPTISFLKYVNIDLGSTSPAKKGKGCFCKRGCNKGCGCKKKGMKCHSGCACTGNCHYVIRIIWIIACRDVCVLIISIGINVVVT